MSEDFKSQEKTGDVSRQIYVCTASGTPPEDFIRAAEAAVRENPENENNFAKRGIETFVKSGIAGLPASSLELLGAILTGRKWRNGRTLRVRFIAGSDPTDENIFKEKVKQYAVEWLQYANLKFEFDSTSENAEITITFRKDNQFWSHHGTDSLLYKPSMNLGFTSASSTTEQAYKSYILHEFGHALGLVHEHNHPENNIPWDKPRVYADYLSWYGWDRDKVDFNVFKKYSTSETNYSAFDKDSIMIYAIPEEHTIGTYSVPDPARLSETDKSFIRRQYPAVS